MHVYSATRLQPKELSSIDFIANENFSILIDREHHFSTWPIFGLPNDQEHPFLWFDKQSHVTRVDNVWRKNQL